MYCPLDNGPKVALGQPNIRLKKRKKASETISSDDSADINLEEFHALSRVREGGIFTKNVRNTKNYMYCNSKSLINKKNCNILE